MGSRTWWRSDHPTLPIPPPSSGSRPALRLPKSTGQPSTRRDHAALPTIRLSVKRRPSELNQLGRYLIMKLRSNTILITVGAGGIGYELTKKLTALGNKVLITGRDQAKMDRAKAAFPKFHTFLSDVSDPEAIATLYEEVTKQFPALNILINNAGIMRKINVHDKAGSLEDITREIEINLSGPIRMVKQFLPHLKTKSEAAIMNVSSSLAFVPLPISPVYCATKAGLHSFTESLRVQLKNTKVKVFDLAPPATQTE